MRGLLRLLGLAGVLVCLVVGGLAGRALLSDRAIEQRGSVTEGVVTEVRGGLLGGLGPDRVVVSLDQLDGRPVQVTQDGPVVPGQRLVVEYDPDGAVEQGKVAGSTRDRDDARTALLAAAAVLVVLVAATPWRRRAGGPAAPAADPPDVQAA